jgi:hypothetical protein
MEAVNQELTTQLLANCLIEFYDVNKETNKQLYLSITKIDEIPLRCYFSFEKCTRLLSFTVESNDIIDDKRDDNVVLFKLTLYCKDVEKEKFLDFAKQVVHFLQNAKLNENGELTTETENDKIENQVNSCFLSLNSSNFEIKKSVECCVCYKLTKTKTLCNHSLCIRCWFSLKLDENEDVYCPLCRESIYFANYNYYY